MPAMSLRVTKETNFSVSHGLVMHDQRATHYMQGKMDIVERTFH